MIILHFYFDSEDTLAQQDVTYSVVDKVTNWLTRVDHETIGKFHGFGTSRTKLSRYDDFATLGTRFHNKSKNTIASTLNRMFIKDVSLNKYINIPTNGKSTKKFVPQTFTLSDSRKTTVLDLLSEEFKRIFREFETFLDESSKLANTATFFTEYFLGVGCTNNDLIKRLRMLFRVMNKKVDLRYLSSSVGYTDIATRVTLLSEFAGEKFIEFGTENTIRYELSLFTDLRGHFEGVKSEKTLESEGFGLFTVRRAEVDSRSVA